MTDEQVVTDSAAAGSEEGTTWADDSVGILFDAKNSTDAGRGTEPFESQYVFTPAGAWRDNEASNPTFGAAADWFAASKPTASGYTGEFKGKKSALLNPQDLGLHGFHLAVNDDDGSNRQAQMRWTGRARSEFTYGPLRLGRPADPGGPITIRTLRVNGDNLGFTMATSSALASLAVQQTPVIAGATWTDSAGVVLSSGGAGTVLAKVPRPAGSPVFYRIAHR